MEEHLTKPKPWDRFIKPLGLELQRVHFYLQLGNAQLYLVPRQN